MRWYEIISESDNVIDQARDAILDMVTPLFSQGINSITTKQVISQLQKDPDFQSIGISDDLIMQALKGVSNMSVEPDASNSNEMTIKLNTTAPTTNAAQHKSDQGQKRVDQAATRQSVKDIGT